MAKLLFLFAVSFAMFVRAENVGSMKFSQGEQQMLGSSIPSSIKNRYDYQVTQVVGVGFLELQTLGAIQRHDLSINGAPENPIQISVLADESRPGFVLYSEKTKDFQVANLEARLTQGTIQDLQDGKMVQFALTTVGWKAYLQAMQANMKFDIKVNSTDGRALSVSKAITQKQGGTSQTCNWKKKSIACTAPSLDFDFFADLK